MKKKVLIVNSFYFPDIVGGAEISTQVLAEKLKEHFEVAILTSSNHKEVVKIDKVNEITVYRMPSYNIYNELDKNNPNSFKKLYWHFKNLFNVEQKKIIKKIIEEFKPEIVHTQNLNGIGTEIWEVANSFNATVIHTLRDYQLKEPTKIRLFNKVVSNINRRRARNVDWVIGISEFILEEFHKEKFFEFSESKVIYNTISNKSIGKKYKKSAMPLKVGYFGRVEKEKGIEYFLESLYELDNNILGELVIVGSGEILEPLKEKYKSNRIKFRGKLSFEETQKQMASVDVVVVPSLWPEPFGRVLIEAYRQGTPVIATNKGGIPEIICDKKMLVEPYDKEGLKKKIKGIFSLDIKSYNDLSNKCVVYSDKFANTHEKYIDLYKEVTK